MNVWETQQLVQEIERRQARALAPAVRASFLHVPRHLFVQQYYQQRGNSLTWDLVEATLETVAQDEALVTRIDERGRPTSSTSQPSVMAMQLEALAPEAGQRVLEIGVGTGYNAALLGKLVGKRGEVISIDIEEDLVEEAKRHLASAEIRNVLALPGDGFQGEATFAPYDRLLATCSIRSVPDPWFDQLKAGGRLVANWVMPLASLFVGVEKTGPEVFEGGLLDLDATYMEMHARGHLPSKQKVEWTQYDVQSPTRMSLPHINMLLHHPAYSVLLQGFLPEGRKRYRSQGDQVQLYLLVPGTAVLVQEDGLLIFGDAAIGECIRESVDLYHRLGSPPISEYRITLHRREAVLCVGDHHFSLPQ